MNVRTICHIFNFFGCGYVYRLVIEGKYEFDIIVINEYRLDESVNQPFLVFLKPQVKIAELMKREQNEILGDLRAFILFSLVVPLDFFFLRLKLFQADFDRASYNTLFDSLHNVVD